MTRKDCAITGYIPGGIGALAALHGRYYGTRWGFARAFEAEVAEDLGAFHLRFDAARDGFWLLSSPAGVHGGLAIDGQVLGDRLAKLRWFILDDAARGHGHGRALLQEAVAFCRRVGHAGIRLWTFDGLHAARRLYESAGFRLAETTPHHAWGPPVALQRFDLDLT